MIIINLFQTYKRADIYCQFCQLFLLVMSCGSTGQNDGCEDGEGQTLNWPRSQSKSGPFYNLAEEISSRHKLEHPTYRQRRYKYSSLVDGCRDLFYRRLEKVRTCKIDDYGCEEGHEDNENKRGYSVHFCLPDYYNRRVA